jgi:hypothetical protein
MTNRIRFFVLIILAALNPEHIRDLSLCLLSIATIRSFINLQKKNVKLEFISSTLNSFKNK